MEEEVGGLFVRNRRLFLLACLVPVTSSLHSMSIDHPESVLLAFWNKVLVSTMDEEWGRASVGGSGAGV